ncbi:MAG: hypothetical protein AB4426_00630 [Xenococcaceae cyanobacterium]
MVDLPDDEQAIAQKILTCTKLKLVAKYTVALTIFDSTMPKTTVFGWIRFALFKQKMTWNFSRV